jgi:hypothetical protein
MKDLRVLRHERSAWNPSSLLKRKISMFRTFAGIGLAAALAGVSSAALAEQGDSTAWGTVGWGPVIPTQSLTPKERSWNHDNEPLYHAGAGAEWLRQHGRGPFPFFQ